MRVVVTGSEGFIGSAICQLLSQRGHDVVRVDIDPRGNEGVHPFDVRKSGEWTALLRGADVVCHQAAKVGAGVAVSDLPAYAAHNDLGTAALLAAMGEADAPRLVLASSMVVYGEGRYSCPTHGEQAPAERWSEALQAGDFENHCAICRAMLRWQLVPEDARLAPRGTYATSKLAQENYARGWATQLPGSVIALRYHNVYGPYMPRDTPYSGVAAMFRSSIERGSAPVVYEDGGQMRDFVHVSDVARANVAAIHAILDVPAGSFHGYNVCSGTPISIREVAQIIGAATDPPLEPVVTGQSRAADVRHIVADPAKAAAELGFSAQIAPADGLRQFVHDPLRESLQR